MTEVCNRERAVAAMALLDDEDGAGALLGFVSDGEAESIRSLIANYSRNSDVASEMTRLVRQLISSERFSTLAEVHPAWILEHLKGESPRIIGIILRLLPSKHVRYILKHIDPMVGSQIPNMVESFSVEPEILEIIRRRFERKFLPMRVSRSIIEPGFENLYFLKEYELEELFKEMGIAEMAVAFCGMPHSILHIIYNRLSVKEAKRLKAAIDEIDSVDPARHCEAKAIFMSIGGEGVGSENLLKTVGLAVLASAIGNDQLDMMKLLQQKLDPATAYLLKRFVDERRLRPGAVPIHAIRKRIVDTAIALAREGRIDEAWSGNVPRGEDASPSEDTKTLRTEGI
jgi:hypothetical protein